MALVSVTEFEARLGRSLSGAEMARAEAVLDDASAIVLSEGDSTWTDATVPGAVAAVLLTAARRAFDNPDGAGQKSTGDVSVSYRQVGLARAELKIIRRAAGRSSISTTLVSPYSGDDISPDLVL